MSAPDLPRWVPSRESVGTEAPDGSALTSGHYLIYASTESSWELHLVAWPIDNDLPLETLLRYWGGRVEVMNVQDTTIGYSPAGAGAPAVAWWVDERGYLVMASVTAPTDSLDLQGILVEGPVN